MPGPGACAACSQDKPLAESDLPLEELARSEGSGEAETKDCEAESAEPVAEGAGMELDAEDVCLQLLTSLRPNPLLPGDRAPDMLDLINLVSAVGLQKELTNTKHGEPIIREDNTDFVASAAESLSTAFDRFEGVLAQGVALVLPVDKPATPPKKA
eukprot:s444_g15.t1